MLPFQLARFKAFILIILFSLLAVACVSGYEKDAGSHDATRDRSSPLASSRATTGEVRNPKALFNVDALLPEDRRTFRYPGSLTTPPCSEGVKWLLMKTSVEVSSAQVQVLKDVVGYNARYTQPLRGREVLEDISLD